MNIIVIIVSKLPVSVAAWPTVQQSPSKRVRGWLFKVVSCMSGNWIFKLSLDYLDLIMYGLSYGFVFDSTVVKRFLVYTWAFEVFIRDQVLLTLRRGLLWRCLQRSYHCIHSSQYISTAYVPLFCRLIAPQKVRGNVLLIIEVSFGKSLRCTVATSVVSRWTAVTRPPVNSLFLQE